MPGGLLQLVTVGGKRSDFFWKNGHTISGEFEIGEFARMRMATFSSLLFRPEATRTPGNSAVFFLLLRSRDDFCHPTNDAVAVNPPNFQRVFVFC